MGRGRIRSGKRRDKKRCTPTRSHTLTGAGPGNWETTAEPRPVTYRDRSLVSRPPLVPSLRRGPRETHVPTKRTDVSVQKYSCWRVPSGRRCPRVSETLDPCGQTGKPGPYHCSRTTSQRLPWSQRNKGNWDGC